jgi:hypothetical protein
MLTSVRRGRHSESPNGKDDLPLARFRTAGMNFFFRKRADTLNSVPMIPMLPLFLYVDLPVRGESCCCAMGALRYGPIDRANGSGRTRMRAGALMVGSG